MLNGGTGDGRVDAGLLDSRTSCFPAFGDTWAFYDEPSHGGVLFSGTVHGGGGARRGDDPGQALHRMVRMISPFVAAE
jgi:hypothetical protein